MKLLKVVALTLAISMTSYGCAAVIAELPAIIAAVQDGMLVLSTIETFCNNYFNSHPNAAAQQKVADALARARAALDLADRAVLATGDINRKQYLDAITDFQAAYTDLLAIVKPYGVTAAGDKLMSTPTGIVVPEPLLFQVKVRK